MIARCRACGALGDVELPCITCAADAMVAEVLREARAASEEGRALGKTRRLHHWRFSLGCSLAHAGALCHTHLIGVHAGVYLATSPPRDFTPWQPNLDGRVHP